MTYRRLSVYALAAISCATMVACDTEAKLTLDDATITSDVAASAGDALATHIESMVGNETSGSFAGLRAADVIGAANATSPTPPVLPAATQVNRTTTCYDVNWAAVANCLPLSSVRRVVTHLTLNGTRTRTDTINGTIRGLTGAVHRIVDDTTTRVFNGSTEASRAHTGVSTANDSTTFTEGDLTRAVFEKAVDSVKAVTWSVPRSTYPISGSIVRVDTVNVTLSKGSRTASRQVVRTITVTFPPNDAQGNVTLTINGKTCSLNLTTHRVGACS